MDSATFDLHMQKLEEFVFDEDKIVTFKWLSCALNICIREAKRLLHQFIQDNQSLKSKKLSIIYLLSGICAGNTLSITIVKDQDLVDKKDLFTKVLKQDIYSVQKAKDLDLNSLSSVDYFNIQDPRENPIADSVISKNCIKRKFKAKPVPELPLPVTKTKTSFFTKVSPKSTENINSKEIVVKTNSIKTSPLKQKSNGSIANIFNKINLDSKTNAIGKHVQQETSEKVEPEKQEINLNKSKGKVLPIVDSDSNSEAENVIAQTPNELPKKRSKNSSKQQPKKRKSEPNLKRRKRILEIEESDDDIFENDEDQNMHDKICEDSEEESLPLSKAKPLAPKNKRRKLVDKTFEDEDGFIVTRKEYVEESASEEEVPPTQNVAENILCQTVKEEIKSNIIKKPDNDVNQKLNSKHNAGKGKKAVAGNQPTLMSFFKKK